MATNPLQKLQMDMQPINRSIPKMHPSTNRTRTQPTTHPNPTTHTTPKLVTDMATPTATIKVSLPQLKSLFKGVSAENSLEKAPLHPFLRVVTLAQ
jgi:hypothetical protein